MFAHFTKPTQSNICLLPLELDADAKNLTLPTSPNAVKFTCKRVNQFYGYGLAILMTYSVLAPQKANEWIKWHLAKEFDIAKNHTKSCKK